MTDENEGLKQDELASLKARADQMGISYHHAIGVKKLKDMIATALSGDEPKKEKKVKKEKVQKETKGQLRARLRKEAGKLIRIRVANMNPNKKDYAGEIYTVGNSMVGSFKKYVPFNNEEGWHVPQIIFNHMKEKECQIFYTEKASNGVKVRKGKLIKELNIEVLPDLTPKEIQELKVKQAMAQGQVT